MAMETGGDGDSEGDTDGDAEEEQSQGPAQQKADEDSLRGNEDAPTMFPRNPADPLPEEKEGD